MFFSITSCSNPPVNDSLIYQEGKNLQSRILVPSGYKRISADKNSFATHLRNLNLHPHGTFVTLYNGEKKTKEDVYCAVVNMYIGKKNLHQCVDAVIHLRADYLYYQKRYNHIHFNFTSGFRADYAKWREGNKIEVQGNNVSWKPYARPLTSDADFWEYLEMVFSYAGTLSLSKELKPIAVSQMQVGDVFIQGGSPGHAVIVVDMAQDSTTGKKIFLLAQSYMPAQEIQILVNRNDPKRSPWYCEDFGETLYTPEWTFTKDDLKRFEE
jgi:hypothetical protein